jgi:hypothetical protein
MDIYFNSSYYNSCYFNKCFNDRDKRFRFIFIKKYYFAGEYNLIYKQNTPKKYLFLLLTLTLAIVLCLSNVLAFQVKYYGNWNQSNINNLTSLYNIPEKYFKGIVAIRIFSNENVKNLACYHYGGVIDFYNGNQNYKLNKMLDTLMHELAHNCQVQRKDTSYNVKNHKGLFDSCLKEITDASN